MARTARLKHTDKGVTYYHLMSRTNDKRFLFSDGRVKTALVDALKRAAAFSGITLKAYVAMDNHFHVVCKVTRSDQAVPPEELIRRVEILKGKESAEDLAEHWAELACAGFDAALEREQNRLRARMNDISEMIKTFKELFNIRFKREHDYCGSIWSGRFASTLIQDGKYLKTCMRYAFLNPVRAQMVKRGEDYAWNWIENEEKCEGFAGPVPAERLGRRVAQIGAGKIFGSMEFVIEELYRFGDRIRKRNAAAYLVVGMCYSSHGWRLAKKDVA